MIRYEYRVLSAPTKGLKAPGKKTPEARHANAVETLLNAQAAEGWEFMRTDLLPSDERQGLTSSQTVYRTVMVFRRPVTDAADEVIADAQAAAETKATQPTPERAAPITPQHPGGAPADPPDADPDETPPKPD
ncbi:DUF4177 domain-containing protein [Roseovarius spongiae]|uniref:DUF4177 domain-containing protein n=1 Tax=Roseovarius spongiae TaxID=2320272 RepID=A0A3A8B391_9RHOB|nr:DUF4177 domain-containing protein [Roseovarius spongiae]RKF14962.1 DUF4177 domain-containing protein [Roseovarius spongiae]